MLFPQFSAAGRSTRASNNKFRVRVDSNEQLSSSSTTGHSKRSTRPPPARVLRKRKRADVTPGSSDSEGDQDEAHGYRKPRNVIDLTSTDDDDHEDYGTADEGSSQQQPSEDEHDSEQEQDPGEPASARERLLRFHC